MSGNPIKTGLEEIDSALGGGLINGGSLLIAYDKRSLGWVLGLRIFRSMLENGAVGVILNTTLPFSKLELRTKHVGLDIRELGEAGALYVIDLFGSKYSILDERPYVIQIRDWSDDTGIPKLIQTYKELNVIIPEDTTVVCLVATLEGLYHEFGKNMMDRIIRASLATFETEVFRNRNILIISMLNKDAVPEWVTGWLYSLSDQIIEFISRIGHEGLEETVLVPKSPLPGFKPRHYTIRLSKEHFIQLI